MGNILCMGYEIPHEAGSDIDGGLGMGKFIEDLNEGCFFTRQGKAIELKHGLIEPLAIGELAPTVENGDDNYVYEEGKLARIEYARGSPETCTLPDNRPKHARSFLDRNYRSQNGFGYGIDESFLREMQGFARKNPKHNWIGIVKAMLRNYKLERGPRPFITVQTVIGESIDDNVFEGIARVCEKRCRTDYRGDIFGGGVIRGSFRYEIRPVEGD